MDQFVFKLSWVQALAPLADEERLRLYDAITLYAHTGKVMDMPKAVEVAFSFIRLDITGQRDAAHSLSDKRRAAGRLGAVSRWGGNGKNGICQVAIAEDCLGREENPVIPLSNSDNGKNGICQVAKTEVSEQKAPLPLSPFITPITPTPEKVSHRKKKEKKEKFDYSGVDDALVAKMREFVDYRARKLKKPLMTQRGFNTRYDELMKIAGGDIAKAIDTVNYTMDNEWCRFVARTEPDSGGKVQKTQKRGRAVVGLHEVEALM